MFVVDYADIINKPIYYSPTLFPIYKYNPRKNIVVNHYDPALAWIAGLILLFFWAFFTNYQLAPEWFGVVMSVGVELLVLITIISMRSITMDSLDSAYEFIDNNVVKKAWIQTKQSYFESEGCISR